MCAGSIWVLSVLFQDLICFQNGAGGVCVPPVAWEPWSEMGVDTGVMISFEHVKWEMTREYKQVENNTDE